MTTSDDLYWIVSLPTTLRLSTFPLHAPTISSFAAAWTLRRPRILRATLCGCQEKRARGRSWRRPIVPRSCPRSLVGAGAFHDRVREGNGWLHRAETPGPTP